MRWKPESFSRLTQPGAWENGQTRRPHHDVFGWQVRVNLSLCARRDPGTGGWPSLHGKKMVLSIARDANTRCGKPLTRLTGPKKTREMAIIRASCGLRDLAAT